MKKLVISTLLIAATAMGASVAQAGSPSIVGSWNILFFLEPLRSIGATQCIVFKSVPGTVAGVPSSGTWESPSFPSWHGEWVQLGDHVRWFGVTGGLATTESGNISNVNTFGGVSFNHFSGTSAATSSAGSFKGSRVARCTQGVKTDGDDPSQPV
jgi:hypothetical protein